MNMITRHVSYKTLPGEHNGWFTWSAGVNNCLSARHVLAIWGFFGFVNLYTLRVDMSVTLVAMVNDSSNPINRSLSNQDSHNGEFNWDEKTQGIILGAFFCGYCVTQIPGGWLAVIVGGKKLFGLGIMVTSLLTLLTPLAASFSLYTLIAVRVLEGAAQGIAFPSMHSLWGKWAPVWERSRLVSFTYAGGQIGTIITLLLTGAICDSTGLGGWPSAFYIFGAAGFLWSVGWMVFVYDCPAHHPRISQQELKYIQESIGETTPAFPSSKKTPIPWRQIFLCKGLWAIVAAHMAADWGSFTMMTCLPQFMKNILDFDLKQDGLLSSLPYMVLFFTNAISGPIADAIRSRGVLSTKATRKLMNSIGLLLPVGFMFGVGYAGSNPALVVTLLCVAIGLNGFTLAGYSVNHLDIAPRYAGLMMSISNTFGTTTGFIGPALVGALTYHNETMAEWRIFFFITACVFAVGGLVFLFLSEGEPGPWYYEATALQEEEKPAIDPVEEEGQKAIYIPDSSRLEMRL